MPPKIAVTLERDIATAEGIAEYAVAGVSAVLGATGDLSVSKTAAYITIVGIVKSIRLGLTKAVAISKGFGIEPTVVSLPAVDKGLQEIEAAVAAATAVQNAPGTPAAEITAGLAPTPIEAAAPTAAPAA